MKRWEPVPDGEYPMVEDAEDDIDFLYVFGNTDPDVCTWVEKDGQSVMLDLGMAVCRLVEVTNEWETCPVCGARGGCSHLPVEENDDIG